MSFDPVPPLIQRRFSDLLLRKAVAIVQTAMRCRTHTVQGKLIMLLGSMVTTISFIRGFDYRFPSFIEKLFESFFVAGGGVGHAISIECLIESSTQPVYVELLISVLAAPLFAALAYGVFRIVDMVKGDAVPTLDLALVNAHPGLRIRIIAMVSWFPSSC